MCKHDQAQTTPWAIEPGGFCKSHQNQPPFQQDCTIHPEREDECSQMFKILSNQERGNHHLGEIRGKIIALLSHTANKHPQRTTAWGKQVAAERGTLRECSAALGCHDQKYV